MLNRAKLDNIIEIQKRGECIRNVCILAHVDHGKTTLADSLIASNNIISKNSVGKVRYLDSREDEQRRGITMKASSISLLHTCDEKKYLINILDSPGHGDFSSEVTIASQLSDGALIIVDVVEGIAAQTRAVMKIALKSNLSCILVLNKLDRLISETKQSYIECYDKLQEIISQANILMGSLEFEHTVKSNTKDLFDQGMEDDIDSNFVYFNHKKRNIIYSCAIDGMGFRICDFAKLYASKFNMENNLPKLEYFLSKNVYYDGKRSKFYKLNSQQIQSGKLNIFCQLILKSLYEVYDTFIVIKNRQDIGKMFKKFNINIPDKRLQNNLPRVLLKQFLQNWLPLDEAVFDSCIKTVPNPLKMSKERCKNAFTSNIDSKDSFISNWDTLNVDLNLAFISKIVLIEKEKLGIEPRLISSVGDNYDSLAIVRVMKGCLKNGSFVFCLGPKYRFKNSISKEMGHVSPEEYLERNLSIEHVTVVQITGLYLIMSTNTVMIQQAQEGNVVGVTGVKNAILKTGTISTFLAAPAFRGSKYLESSVPLVNVVVQAKFPYEMEALRDGLALLNKSDSAVEISICKNGDYQISTCGEVHLNKCLDDLRNDFLKIQILVSEPIVPFRETVVDLKKNFATESIKVCSFSTKNEKFTSKIQSKSLHENMAEIFSQYNYIFSNIEQAYVSNPQLVDSVLKKLYHNTPSWFISKKMAFLSFGGDKVESNVFIVETSVENEKNVVIFENFAFYRKNSFPYFSQLHTAFQLTCEKGPLCNEPLCNTAFILSDMVIVENVDDNVTCKNNCHSMVKPPNSTNFGEIIPIFVNIMTQTLFKSRQRLVVAINKCVVETISTYLGKTINVIKKRNGTIISSELRPFSYNIYSVEAEIPVVDSYGIFSSLKSETSGSAHGSLSFLKWKVLDISPFWKPSTDEELEHYGEKSDVENVASKYVNDIRRRRGLYVHEQIIENAEKQRNLTRNK